MAPVDRARRRWSLVDRAARTYGAYQAGARDRDAAGLSYYAFLSVFPMLLVGVAFLGFVMRDAADVRATVLEVAGDALPGSESFLSGSLDEIIDRAAEIGAVGLAWLVYSALGAVGVLRGALDEVFGVPERGGVGGKLRNLRVAAASGVLLLVSVGLSTMASWGMNALLVSVGVDAAWLRVAGSALALVVTLAGDLVLFTVLFWLLPDHEHGWRRVLPGAVVGAVAFGALKHLAGMLFAASAARASAAYGVAAGVFGLLAAINLSARLTLFAATWAAVGLDDA